MGKFNEKRRSTKKKDISEKRRSAKKGDQRKKEISESSKRQLKKKVNDWRNFPYNIAGNIGRERTVWTMSNSRRFAHRIAPVGPFLLKKKKDRKKELNEN